MSFYYGSSGDIRTDMTGGVATSNANYKWDNELSGVIIERGRKYAFDLINAKLKIKYPTNIPFPSGSVPGFIDEVANVFAKAFVIRNTSRGPAPKDSEKYNVEAKSMLEMLDQIAQGEMELPGLDQEVSDVYHTHQNRVPAADVDNIYEQETDPNLLDDIADRRQ